MQRLIYLILTVETQRREYKEGMRRGEGKEGNICRVRD